MFARLRSLWHGLLRRSDVESDMAEEFRIHIELRAEDLTREGLSPDEARRRAHLEFGHEEAYREASRASRGLRFFDRIGFSWLDFKLGFRMLVRYPGLTIMGGLAMAAGIAFGAGFFEFASQWAHPDLGFPEQDRLVGIVVQETGAMRRDGRLLSDFARWREELQSVEELGAFRLVGRNLTSNEGPGEPVVLTEVSASAFRLADTAPLIGRYLTDDDERPDAPDVVVLGFDLWQDRFGGAADAIGRTVRVGEVRASVVGVMPEGFEFPRSQNIWAPLRLDPLDYPPGEGPGIYVFGRLANGTTLAQAQAEVATLGLSTTIDRPYGGARLTARVVPFPELVYRPIPGFFDPAFIQINVFVLALVVLLCANVALLLFARAASRESELVVRNALGAGRSRIVIQLFSEALVLGGVAAIVGLFGARYGYEWFLTVVEASEGPQPFWFAPRISSMTAVYVVGLTLLGAGIAGVLPGLKITRGLAAGLRESSAGGGGLKFGGVWTVVIVAQIAVTLPLPALAYWAAKEMAEETGGIAADIDTAEYLTTRVTQEENLNWVRLDPGTSPPAPDSASTARYAASLDELERRLLAEGNVVGVTFADRLPLAYHPFHQIEMEEGAVEPPDDRGHRVGLVEVEPNYFDALGAPILRGRAFDSEDVVSGARVAIVDEPFVQRVLGGGYAVGRSLREVAAEGAPPGQPPGPWYEIVGVVGDLGIENGYGRGGIYRPVERGSSRPTNLIVHLRTDPSAFAPRLRALAADVDPTLRLESLLPLNDVPKANRALYSWGVSAVTVLTLVGLMLSLAGIYSVMSFTVARRTREIGIRVALGARARRLIPSIFRRPFGQLVLGIVAGALLMGGAADYLFGGLTAAQFGLVGAYSSVMLCVCMLACVVPTRRALRIEPIEALTVDG